MQQGTQAQHQACVGVIPSAHQYGPPSKMEKGSENLLQWSLKYLMFLEDSPKSWVLFCWVLPDDRRLQNTSVRGRAPSTLVLGAGGRDVCCCCDIGLPRRAELRASGHKGPSSDLRRQRCQRHLPTSPPRCCARPAGRSRAPHTAGPPPTHGVRHGSRRSLGEHKSHRVLENCTQVVRWVQSICRALSRSCLSR